MTGDPMGLAQALAKIEQSGVPWWQLLFMPGNREVSPSLLRSHPLTSERIERLRQIAREYPQRHPLLRQTALPEIRIMTRPLHWQPLGIWL
ncbi:MAG: Zn-dependent protease, partial [Mariprofundus sp.]